MTNLREQIEGYIKRVKDLSDHVRGNEQATKQSLVGPFFTMLGYDLTDPRECIPEYKADFGKDRSTKPIDWAFLHNGIFAFFVEAKEVGRKLGGFDEQLADYFAKDPNVKLGILTNGAQWRFFTDIVNPNVMDQEPFGKWDVFAAATCACTCCPTCRAGSCGTFGGNDLLQLELSALQAEGRGGRWSRARG